MTTQTPGWTPKLFGGFRYNLETVFMPKKGTSRLVEER
jgi:hypothetical protein